MEQDDLRSIRFFSRARTSERGFVLVAAMTLAVLYFALMNLLLVDSSRELAEARRFRARIIAGVLAENAVELAAQQMVDRTGNTIEEETAFGEMWAEYSRGGGDGFEISAEATTKGVLSQTASVFVQGRLLAGGIVKIDYTMHGQ